jgi:hypothetical protein
LLLRKELPLLLLARIFNSALPCFDSRLRVQLSELYRFD